MTAFLEKLTTRFKSESTFCRGSRRLDSEEAGEIGVGAVFEQDLSELDIAARRDGIRSRSWEGHGAWHLPQKRGVR